MCQGCLIGGADFTERLCLQIFSFIALTLIIARLDGGSVGIARTLW